MDEAWRAMEEALPAGWRFLQLDVWEPDDRDPTEASWVSRYLASATNAPLAEGAWTDEFEARWQLIEGIGPTPTDALNDLAGGLAVHHPATTARR